MALPPIAAKPIDVDPVPRTRAPERGFVVGAVAQPAVITLSFPKSAKVRTGADYTRVFEQSRRTSDPLLAVHFHASDRPARLGLAVSRKVDKRAVERNRIKRGLREQFRAVRWQLPQGDYVVVARPAAASRPLPELRETFLRVLVRAGALPASAMDGTMPGRLTPLDPHSRNTSEPATPAG